MPARCCYGFNRCTLLPHARSLRVDGQDIALKPTAFDLLVYLLRHRDRPVSKDELLDRVWSSRTVTVGSVARAVMTVRQAIRDDGEPPMILTMHRLGYRFIGEVDEFKPDEDARALAPNRVPPVLLALLPADYRNARTKRDRATSVWLATVGNSLANDSRFNPLPAPMLDLALRDLRPGASADELVSTLQRNAGVTHVVRTRIEQGPDGWRLDYRPLTVERGDGSLHAESLMALGHLLARQLAATLLSSEGPGPGRLATREAWTAELFARAMQALAERHHRHARYLLRVVLDHDPWHFPAMQELARMDASSALQAGTQSLGISPGNARNTADKAPPVTSAVAASMSGAR